MAAPTECIQCHRLKLSGKGRAGKLYVVILPHPKQRRLCEKQQQEEAALNAVLGMGRQ